MEIKEAQEKISEVHKKYQKKFKIDVDEDWYVLKLQEEVGEMSKAFLAETGRARKEGSKEDFCGELADVFGQTLLIAEHLHIDIEEALERKWFRYLKNDTEGDPGDFLDKTDT